MHANYLSPEFAARGETRLRDPEKQLNFFTLPQTVSFVPLAYVPYAHIK